MKTLLPLSIMVALLLIACQGCASRVYVKKNTCDSTDVPGIMICDEFDD